MFLTWPYYGFNHEESKATSGVTVTVTLTHTIKYAALLPFRDLLFGSIYDTFSGEDNLSKAVFLEHLCEHIQLGKLRNIRTVVAKDFVGEAL